MLSKIVNSLTYLLPDYVAIDLGQTGRPSPDISIVNVKTIPGMTDFNLTRFFYSAFLTYHADAKFNFSTKH